MLKGRTDDEADHSVVPQSDRLKFLLCILKSFWNGQPVKVNRSLGETLVREKNEHKHSRPYITTRWPTYLVLLLESDLSRLLIQVLHRVPMCESISAVYLGSIVIPFPSRAVGLLTRLLHLVLTASRMFP